MQNVRSLLSILQYFLPSLSYKLSLRPLPLLCLFLSGVLHRFYSNENYSQFFFTIGIHRVGSHLVFVWIHCAEECPTSFNNDVLSKSKERFLRVFSSLPRKVYTIFQPSFFPDLTMPGYPYKASYFEYRLCHKFFSGEDRA